MYNQNASFGRALLNSLYGIIPTLGKVHVVMSSSDVNDPNYDKLPQIIQYDPDGVLRFYTDLDTAYANVTSNNDDVVLLDAHSTHTTAGLTVSKNRVHFIGMDGGGRLTAHGAKISLSDNTTAVAATIINTGTRNSFRNLKVINEGTDASSVAGMIDSGEGTLIENCSILKLSDLNVATVADFICRADSATYKNVEFGFDTLVQSAARPTFWFKNDGATRAKHVKMIDCHFTCASSEATKSFIKVENTSSLAFSNDIIRPTFNNALVASLSAAALNDAVTSASGLVEGNINIYYPASNTTEFCSTVTDQIWVYGPAGSAQAGEGNTPS